MGPSGDAETALRGSTRARLAHRALRPARAGRAPLPLGLRARVRELTATPAGVSFRDENAVQVAVQCRPYGPRPGQPRARDFAGRDFRRNLKGRTGLLVTTSFMLDNSPYVNLGDTETRDASPARSAALRVGRRRATRELFEDRDALTKFRDLVGEIRKRDNVQQTCWRPVKE